MREFATRMMSIDRRVLYAVLLGIIVFGLLVPVNLPLSKAEPAQRLYNAIERADPNKIALVSTVWSNSTRGENGPQTEVVLRHLMQRRIKIALISFVAEAQVLGEQVCEAVAKEYGYEYGRDWINLGYRQDMLGTLKAIVIDLPGTYKTDTRFRRPLSQFPITQNVKNIKDVGLVVEIAPSGSYKFWIQLMGGSLPEGQRLSYSFCATSVMVPELYPYLDSGQMDGMLFGIKGAAEYEDLLKLPPEKRLSTRYLSPLSLSLIYLFGLIFLGNLGMYLARRGQEGAA